jgi:hypothetical protein
LKFDVDPMIVRAAIQGEPILSLAGRVAGKRPGKELAACAIRVTSASTAATNYLGS